MFFYCRFVYVNHYASRINMTGCQIFFWAFPSAKTFGPYLNSIIASGQAIHYIFISKKIKDAATILNAGLLLVTLIC